MTPKIKQGQNSAQPNARVTIYSIDQKYTTIRAAIKWAGIVGCIYMLGVAIEPFAGEKTAMSLVISLLADLKFMVSIALTGAACAWAVVENVLRRRKTDQLQGRIIELETMIDPKRSSSGLTTQGKTNPKDKRS